jgi:hypothetical protein
MLLVITLLIKAISGLLNAFMKKEKNTLGVLNEKLLAKYRI